MSYRSALAATVLVCLGGCATPEQRAAHMQAEVEHMMAIYGPACVRLGYAAGTDAWRGCVLSLDLKDDVQRSGPAGPYDGWGPGYRYGYWGRYW
jgi:hypothetical protein